MSATYRIELPQFEGPFDLLLFFIERDEIDIRNIPISRIADDFQAYVMAARELNLTLAGDFILMAATLMSIKARVLIPRLPIDEEGNEIDPRQELADRLLEYKRYREVLEDLRRLEADRGQRFVRQPSADQLMELAAEAEMAAEAESVTIYRLFSAFQRVLQKQRERGEHVVHRVVRWPYTVEDQSARILSALADGAPSPFETLFAECENRIHAVTTFLALLELLHNGRLQLRQQSDRANDFYVERAVATPQDESTALDSTNH